MDSVSRMMEHLPGSNFKRNDLVEEMKELKKLRTAIMMEKCQSRDQVVVCPKPRKANGRLSGERNEFKVADTFDVISASPPYFSGSPPIRCSNPVIQDAHFHGRKQCKQSRNFV